MAIDTTCPSCGRTLRVDDSFAERKARCPICNHVTIIPQPVAEQPVLSPIEDTNSPTANPQTPESDVLLYYVRVPNGQIYGPSSAAVLKDWASQGRINDTCDVRSENTDLWIAYSAWLIQQRGRSASPSSAPVTRNIYGDNFGEVVTPMNQTPTKASGLGVLICCLGVASWFLCVSFIGAPICAIVTIVLAVIEFQKIADGRTPREEKMLVHIGLWLSVANLVVSMGLMLLFFVLAAISP